MDMDPQDQYTDSVLSSGCGCFLLHSEKPTMV